MPEINTHKLWLIGGVAAFAVVSSGVLLYRSLRKKKKYVEVGKLEKIYIYPVKSCRGIELQNGDCTRQGMKYKALKDRHWLVVNEEDRFTTIRQQPRMVLITPSLSEDGNYLLLDAPEMATLKVPIDVKEISEDEQKIVDTRVWGLDIQGVYCGQEAEDWLSQYFQAPGYKLIHAAADIKLREASDADRARARPIAKRGDMMAYQDDAAFMLMSQESLDDLNQKLDKPVTMRNFRPNLVMSGSPAFHEDNWQFIKIGDVVLRHMKCDERCTLTTVDPETGIRSDSSEPLKTLKTYRKCKPEDKPLYKESPLMGVHLGLDDEGPVCLGDTVYAVCH